MQEPKKVPTLTDCADELSLLNHNIQCHTEARKYLAEAIEDGFNLPRVTIHRDEQSGPSASMDMAMLSTDLVELLLSEAVAHEERCVFDAWRKLKIIVDTADQIIAQVIAKKHNYKQVIGTTNPTEAETEENDD